MNETITVYLVYILDDIDKGKHYIKSPYLSEELGPPKSLPISPHISSEGSPKHDINDFYERFINEIPGKRGVSKCSPVLSIFNRLYFGELELHRYFLFKRGFTLKGFTQSISYLRTKIAFHQHLSKMKTIDAIYR